MGKRGRPSSLTDAERRERQLASKRKYWHKSRAQRAASLQQHQHQYEQPEEQPQQQYHQPAVTAAATHSTYISHPRATGRPDDHDPSPTVPKGIQDPSAMATKESTAILSGKYPAKAHARKVAAYIQAQYPNAQGVIYLEGQKTRMIEDNDEPQPFRLVICLNLPRPFRPPPRGGQKMGT